MEPMSLRLEVERSSQDELARIDDAVGRRRTIAIHRDGLKLAILEDIRDVKLQFHSRSIGGRAFRAEFVPKASLIFFGGGIFCCLVTAEMARPSIGDVRIQSDAGQRVFGRSSTRPLKD